MAKLLIKSGGEQNREISLQPGANRIGRSVSCDFQIVDASVSSSHCEIHLKNGAVHVRDLGSTNGTFINGQQINESTLDPGQVLRLGNVELFYPVEDTIAEPREKIARPAVRIVTAASKESTQPASAGTRLQVVQPEAPPPLPPRIGPAPAARQYMMAPPRQTETFFQRLPSALTYPFRRNGFILLVTGTLFFGILTGLLSAPSFGLFALLGILVLGLFTSGYLAAYLLKIIVSSAGGEEELPAWPDFNNWWDDIIQPALLVIATFVVSFAPVLGVAFWGGDLDPSVRLVFLVASLLFGCFYLPMGLLAVAMYDSMFALNPLLIVPSIIKIPKEYLAACFTLALIIVIETACSFVLNLIPIWIIPALISGFLSLYFLAVEMRILGLMYQTKQDDLNWSF